MTRVLIVDDDSDELQSTAEIVSRAGFTPLTAGSGETALMLLRADPAIAAVVLDLVMPDRDGMAVLEAMRRENLGAAVIVVASSVSVDAIGGAMRQGAADFIVKPVTPDRLAVSLRNALRLAALETALRSERHRRAGTLGLADISAESPAMHRVVALCRKAARNTFPVLIEGEPGVGKDFVARIIQGLGDRAGKPLVAINCAAIPESSIEAVLFGQKRVAADGTSVTKPGKFAEAHGGTLLIDDIGELSRAMQAKLLRVLETGEIEPLGAARPERVNVRVIAASSRRLLNLARNGSLREDLYYRLNVLPIYVPPLRERPEDIAPLAAGFIARSAAEAHKRIDGLSPQAMTLLKSCAWPDNVRQLEHAIYRSVALAESTTLEVVDFPHLTAQVSGRDATVKLAQNLDGPSEPVHIDFANSRRKQTEGPGQHPDRFLTESGEVTPLAALERELIVFAIGKYQGRMSRIARALGIGRSTLYRKLRDYGLEGGVDSDAA